MSVAAAVEEKIASKKVVVYCQKAKQVFTRYLKSGKLKREDYEEVDITRDPQCVAIQTYMMKKTGGRTVSIEIYM